MNELKKEVQKRDVLKKTEQIFQSKKVEFNYGSRTDSNEISEHISDKLLTMIKKNVC